MSFSAGTRLEFFEIVGLLGAGGMGEVYRARDTKLNREVAIKVLPEAFANDPDRLARFEREAQVLATRDLESPEHRRNPWNSRKPWCSVSRPRTRRRRDASRALEAGAGSSR